MSDFQFFKPEDFTDDAGYLLAPHYVLKMANEKVAPLIKQNIKLRDLLQLYQREISDFLSEDLLKTQEPRS